MLFRSLTVAARPLALPRALPGGPLTLGVRPEYVTLDEPGSARAVCGTVLRVQDIGTHLVLTAQVEGTSVKAKLPPDAAVPAAGQPVWLRVLGEHTCFYVNEELVA